jgi:hypothetical protein
LLVWLGVYPALLVQVLEATVVHLASLPKFLVMAGSF